MIPALILNVAATLLNVAFCLLWDNPFMLFPACVSAAVAMMLIAKILNDRQ